MRALPGILIGLAAGTILGVLLAPKSGKTTRADISSNADDLFRNLQDQLQSGLDNIKSQYNEFVETSASRAQEGIGRAKRRSKF